MAKKVLVVDDEKLIVKGIRFSLEQEGMEVDCAYDGEEALNAVKQNTYDVILLDVMLPKLSGFEVCQQIREFSDVPIIMLTAKGDEFTHFRRPCHQPYILPLAYSHVQLLLLTTAAEPILIGSMEIIITDNLRTQAL